MHRIAPDVTRDYPSLARWAVADEPAEPYRTDSIRALIEITEHRARPVITLAGRQSITTQALTDPTPTARQRRELGVNIIAITIIVMLALTIVTGLAALTALIIRSSW